MKRLITITALIFSVSFCMAQNIKDQVDKQKQIEAQQQQAIKEKKQREAEAQRRAKEAEEERVREIERYYQNAIESAERNVEQKRYEMAKQDYLTAYELKPENTAFINERLNKIEALIVNEKREREEAERESQYQASITSAQKNVDQKKYGKAQEDYRSALKIKPENFSFINQKLAEIEKPATLELYYDKGNSCLEQNKYEEALGYFKQANQLDPQNSVYQEKIRTTEIRIKQERFMNAAESSYRNSQYKQAVDNVGKAKELGSLPAHMQSKADTYQRKYAQEEAKRKEAGKKVLKTIGLIALVAIIVGVVLLIPSDEKNKE